MNHKVDYIEIQTRLKRVNRTQKYLSSVFNRAESNISIAIRGERYPTLREKIIKHIELLEKKLEQTHVV